MGLGQTCCLPRTLASLKGDATPHPVGVPTTLGPGPPPHQAPRRRRYTLTPARLRWDHFNLTYRCDPRPEGSPGAAWPPPAPTPTLSLHPRILSFPRNLLSPRETRQGLATAFRMWSEVSPFSFREVAAEQPSDLRIGGCSAPAPGPPPGPLSAPCSPRLLPGQPHGLPGVCAAPLLRRPHGRAGPRLLPPARWHPL